MLRTAARGLRELQVLSQFRASGCRFMSDGASSSHGPGPGAQSAAAAAAAASQRETAAAAVQQSSSGGPESASRAATSQHRSILEQAAAAQDHRAAAAAAAAVEAEQQPRSSLGKAFSLIGNTLFLGGLGAGAYFGYYTYYYSPEDVEVMVQAQSASESAPNQLWATMMAWYVEQRRWANGEVKKYADPPSDALLPDHPPNLRLLRTLVLDLDEVLVHSDWTRARGWRTFKRPGVEDFLKTVSSKWEVVVYTSQLPSYADPILNRLDPHHSCIAYRLYRDSTLYQDGKHLRDLGKLNRDLSKVLLITSDADAYSLHPDNCVKLEPWKLEADDTKLLDLIPFLEAVQQARVQDVRSVVRSYAGEDIPKAFMQRMAKLQEQPRKPRAGFLGFSRS